MSRHLGRFHWWKRVVRVVVPFSFMPPLRGRHEKTWVQVYGDISLTHHKMLTSVTPDEVPMFADFGYDE